MTEGRARRPDEKGIETERLYIDPHRPGPDRSRATPR